jgi:hypothetical protein
MEFGWYGFSNRVIGNLFIHIEVRAAMHSSGNEFSQDWQ